MFVAELKPELEIVPITFDRHLEYRLLCKLHTGCSTHLIPASIKVIITSGNVETGMEYIHKLKQDKQKRGYLDLFKHM